MTVDTTKLRAEIEDAVSYDEISQPFADGLGAALDELEWFRRERDHFADEVMELRAEIDGCQSALNDLNDACVRLEAIERAARDAVPDEPIDVGEDTGCICPRCGADGEAIETLRAALRKGEP